MSLWRLASSSLLLSPAKSFVVPPASISQHVAPSAVLTHGSRRDVWGSAVPLGAAPRATRNRRLSAAAEDEDEIESDEFIGRDGPRLLRDDPADVPEPAVAARDPLGDLDALDDLLGVHSSGSSSSISGQSTLDALDDLLRRDAVTTQGPSSSSPSAGGADSGGALADDGFGALDDLLGLEDGALLLPPTGTANSQSSSPTVNAGGDGADSGNPNLAAIDPFQEFDVPGRRDSLDELLSQSLPSAPEPVARQRSSSPGVSEESASSPAMGAVDPDSWLDDLLKLDSDDFSSAPGGAAASNAAATGAGGKGGGRRGANARVLESLIDEVSSVPGGAPVAAGTSANTDSDIDIDVDTDSGSARRPAPDGAAADAPAAIDDWLNDLLEENEGASKPSPVGANQPGAAARGRPADPWTDAARDNVNENVNDSDPWDFGGDGGGAGAGAGGGGGYGDVITGSNQLEGWKANMEAPRSNVMGRAKGRGNPAAAAPPGDTQQRGLKKTDGYQGEGQGDGRGGWEQKPERGFSRGSDWGEGGGWGDEGGRGLKEWERGSSGSGAGGAKVLDATEEAQRATTADLVALGKRGEWEDALRALVGARVRGVPVNVQMYNR